MTQKRVKNVKITTKKVSEFMSRYVFGNASVFLFLIAWEVLPRYGIIDKTLVPSFSSVVERIYSMAVKGQFFQHVTVSLRRAAIGFLLATFLGTAMGFLLGGVFKGLEKMLTPLLRLLEKINPFALFPVFILIFGIGEVSKVAMILWVSQWPILFNTITGIKNMDPLFIKSARSMGASRRTLFLKVVLPSAVPDIFNGLKIGGQIAFIIVIAAEMMGASKGMGWLTANAQATYKLTQLYGATMTITLVGFLINKFFRCIESRFLTWRETAFEGNDR